MTGNYWTSIAIRIVYNVGDDSTVGPVNLRVRDLYARALLSTEKNTGDCVHLRKCELTVVSLDDACTAYQVSGWILSC